MSYAAAIVELNPMAREFFRKPGETRANFSWVKNESCLSGLGNPQSNDELNAMAPELFTKPGRSRRKFSLDEIRTLLSGLGNPQSRFRSVLIAGTNGKGSTDRKSTRLNSSHL